MKKTLFSLIIIIVSNVALSQTVSFNFTAGAATVGGWTNVAGDPSTGVRSATASGITVSSVATANWKQYSGSCAYNDGGMTTGTYFPAGVMVNHWFQFNEPPSTVATYNVSAPQLEVSGLSAGSKYTLKLTGSNRYTLNSTIVSYRVGGYVAYGPLTVNTMNNTANGAEFNNVFADTAGKIRVYLNTVTSPSATQMANISGLQVITATSNQAPVPDAGTDQTVNLPATSTTLNGSATDADGTIASYAWTKISGGSATITSPTSASTTVTGLYFGDYIFRLTVTDNVGAVRTNDMSVTVTVAEPVDTSLLVHKTGDETIDSTKTFLKDIVVNGLRIGKGKNSVEYNLAIGASTLTRVTTGNVNVALGSFSQDSLTTGSWNVAVGGSTLKSNLVGEQNTAIGYAALRSNLSSFNVAVGFKALEKNTTGIYNTAVGTNSLINNTTGQYNTAVGHAALIGLYTGNQNSVFGRAAGRGVATGSRNVIVGDSTGYNEATVGDGNVLIGSGVMKSNATLLNNKLVIGNRDNEYIVEGDFATHKLKIKGYQNSSLLDSVLTTDTDGNMIMRRTGWYQPPSSNNMFNNNTGSVYIGATTGSYADTAYKLYVEKGIRTRKVKVDVLTWADFVFSDNYELPSLETVQAFIKKNKHLPGIPSEEEARKNGLDIAESQAMLLQKIEELTLYIIEQDKKIKELAGMQNEIQELKVLISEIKK